MAPNTRPGSKRVRCEVFEQPILSSRDSCQHGMSSIHAKSIQSEVANFQHNEVIEPPNLHSMLRSRHNYQRGTSSTQVEEEDILHHNTNSNSTTCQATDVLLVNEVVPVNGGDCNDNADKTVINKKKKVRGATCMPKVWGQQPDELVVVSFNDLGQPNDQDKTSTLSHFLGTIARNGRYCPLNYADWRLMSCSYKQEMLRIVKARFQLPPGHETYILRSINKKWRNWKSFVKSLSFDPEIPIEQQMMEIPERVNGDQYKSLVQHWMSDKSKKQSEKNKDTRDQLELVHHMGKKSFAVVKEKLRQQYGRDPTRSEVFIECYGSSKRDKIQEAIVKMKQLVAQDSQNSNGNQGMYNPDDSFAKVMGKDKDGQLRMYGLGVTALDVYGEKPSRATLLRQAMEYKAKFMEAVEKYETLNAKIDNLSAHVHGTQSMEQTNAQSRPLTSPNEVGLQNAPLTSLNEQDGPAYHPLVFSGEQVDARNNQNSLGSTLRPMQIKVGSYVVLKSLANINEIVATGVVDEMDNVRVNGANLGTDFCQVVIQHMVKKDARLIFPYKNIQTIGNALGIPITWPLSLVELDLDDEFHC